MYIECIATSVTGRTLGELDGDNIAKGMAQYCWYSRSHAFVSGLVRRHFGLVVADLLGRRFRLRLPELAGHLCRRRRIRNAQRTNRRWLETGCRAAVPGTGTSPDRQTTTGRYHVQPAVPFVRVIRRHDDLQGYRPYPRQAGQLRRQMVPIPG